MFAKTPNASLLVAFDHVAAIQDTLAYFPTAAANTWYYDPVINRPCVEELDSVHEEIKNSYPGICEQDLASFLAKIKNAILTGRGEVIPLETTDRYPSACYLMPELAVRKKPARLRGWFGAASEKWDLQLLQRLAEEFGTRHELAHAIEMLEPDYRRAFWKNGHEAQESEGISDNYALLSQFVLHRKQTPLIHDFAQLVGNARLEKNSYDPTHATYEAIRNLMDCIREDGVDRFSAANPVVLFEAARSLAKGPMVDIAYVA